MKQRKWFSFIMCLSIVTFWLIGCTAPVSTNLENSETITSSVAKQEELLKKLEKAYIYTFPLIIMDATKTKMTNTIEATSVQAPENQFIHAKGLATAASKDIVTPNVDTVYSQLFLNLSEDAVIVELPKTDRFCTAEVLDAYTNCITVIDTATFKEDTETLIFTGADFTGTIPNGMKEIECPTNLAWILIRTISYGENDLPNVYKIQEKMNAYTLSQISSNHTLEKPKGVFKEENNFIPVEHVLNLSMTEYFTRANQLMKENPPAVEDRQLLEEISEIQVGPGLSFNDKLFGEEIEKEWQKLVSNMTEICMNHSKSFIVKNGIWDYFGAPIAEFGTEYYYRALIALAGFGANPVSVAIYPKATVDIQGERLTGANQYILHFDKDRIPQIKEGGFWSVTIYDSSNNFLVDNELNQYCINDRSQAIYNEDGSLDIYIQNQNPGEEKSANWLPAPEGEFHLYLRIYLPTDEVIRNEQTMPIVQKNE